MRKVVVFACLLLIFILMSAGNSVWLPVLKRYEKEADTLPAADRKSEALLAWIADTSNHSAV